MNVYGQLLVRTIIILITDALNLCSKWVTFCLHFHVIVFHFKVLSLNNGCLLFHLGKCITPVRPSRSPCLTFHLSKSLNSFSCCWFYWWIQLHCLSVYLQFNFVLLCSNQLVCLCSIDCVLCAFFQRNWIARQCSCDKSSISSQCNCSDTNISCAFCTTLPDTQLQ